jgi:hypothetical protein
MLFRCEGVEPPMSQLGQSLPKWAVHVTSAFHPLATEQWTLLGVRFVPKSGVANFIQLPVR